MSDDFRDLAAGSDSPSRPGTSAAGWALGLSLVSCCYLGNLYSTKIALDILADDRRSRRPDRTPVSLAVAALAINAVAAGSLVLLGYVYLGLGLGSLEDGRVARPLENANPAAVVSYDVLTASTCVVLGDETSRDRVVPCGSAHDAEVYAQVPLPAGAYPGDAAVERVAQRCEGRLFRDYVGVDRARSALTTFSYYPDAITWAEPNRYVACIAGDPAGEPLTGSLRDSRR
ncbi:septum formation family protein [Pimelobacter simplex]|uniref:septum formation family protein n=1 Tax=Nocardioides simplex TaxID=2045 RepID=UPI003AAC32E8